MTTIKIQTNDGIDFLIEKNLIIKSKTINGMLTDLCIDENNQDFIPLFKINSKTFKKIVEWLEYHKDDPPMPDSPNHEKESDDIIDWDLEFFATMTDEEIFELILASTFLDIGYLYDTGCKTVANVLKKNTPRSNRKRYGLKDDFTDEQRAQIAKEREDEE